MLNDINDISIHGGVYKDKTTLKNLLGNPLNLLLGANGSGKSTIARALASAADGEPSSYQAYFGSAEITQEQTQLIRVFNEDFVDKNVRLTESGGLKTIAMLGSAAGASAQATKLAAEIASKERDLEMCKNGMKGLRETADAINSDYENIAIQGYCIRFRDIKGNKSDKAMGDSDWEKIENATPDAAWPNTEKELRAIIERDTERLRSCRQGGEVVWSRPQFDYADQLTRTHDILRKAIKQPLTNDDRYLLDIALHEIHYLEESRTRIVEKGADYCPLCQRQIDADYRDVLMQKINDVLNDEAEAFRRDIQAAISGLRQFEWVGFPTEATDLLRLQNTANLRYKELNNEVLRLTGRLEEKLDNLYVQMPGFDLVGLRKEFAEYDGLLNQLEEAVEQHNQDVEREKQMQKELLHMNEYLSYLETAEVRSKLSKNEVAQERQQNQIRENLDKLAEMRREHDRLLAATLEVGVAMDLINGFITKVFCDSNRLRLCSNDDQTYRLTVRGEDVTPNRVSVGERNILALAYFFASLCKDDSIEHPYSQEMLVVIDDPVSSFDEGSRTGIMSLLTGELQKVLLNNNESKVLVLSHDFYTIMDLYYMWSYVGAAIMKRRGVADPREAAENFAFYELSGLQLSRQEGRPRHYKRLITDLYNFGFNFQIDSERPEMSKGNMIRQFLEQYASFMYSGDPYAMLKKSDLLAMVTEPVVRDSLQSETIRLVINRESHGLSSKSVMRFDAEPIYVQDELRKIAQSIIWFVYFTNPGHLEAYLNDKPGNNSNWRHLMQKKEHRDFFPRKKY